MSRSEDGPPPLDPEQDAIDRLEQAVEGLARRVQDGIAEPQLAPL